MTTNAMVKPSTKGWGRPNLVHNTHEKTFEGILKHEMIGWTNSQAFMLNLAHDFKHTWCELEDMSKMMLETEWSCSSFFLQVVQMGENMLS